MSWTKISKVLGGLLPLLLAGGMTSCKRHTPCGRLYERFKACDKTMTMSKRDFLDTCRAERKAHPEVLGPQFECSKKEDCDAFKKCLAKARQDRLEREMAKVLEEALRTKKWQQALARCAGNRRDLTDSLKKRCHELAQQAYESVRSQLLELRDAGKPATDAKAAQLCLQLRLAGQELGKRAQADALCSVELVFASRIRSLLEAASQSLGKDPKKTALSCAAVVSGLRKARFRTKWVQAKERQLVDKCIAPAAKALVDKALTSKPKQCPPDIVALRATIAPLVASSPALSEALKQAEPVCGPVAGRGAASSQAKPRPR